MRSATAAASRRFKTPHTAGSAPHWSARCRPCADAATMPARQASASAAALASASRALCSEVEEDFPSSQVGLISAQSMVLKPHLKNQRKVYVDRSDCSGGSGCIALAYSHFPAACWRHLAIKAGRQDRLSCLLCANGCHFPHHRVDAAGSNDLQCSEEEVSTEGPNGNVH